VGLGQQTTIDVLEIIWPQGKKEVYRHIPADQYITIVQGKGFH
jgi:hypothetical protein